MPAVQYNSRYGFRASKTACTHILQKTSNKYLHYPVSGTTLWTSLEKVPSWNPTTSAEPTNVSYQKATWMLTLNCWRANIGFCSIDLHCQWTLHQPSLGFWQKNIQPKNSLSWGKWLHVMTVHTGAYPNNTLCSPQRRQPRHTETYGDRS